MEPLHGRRKQTKYFLLRGNVSADVRCDEVIDAPLLDSIPEMLYQKYDAEAGKRRHCVRHSDRLNRTVTLGFL